MYEKKTKDLGVEDVIQAFTKKRGVPVRGGHSGRGKSAVCYARIGWNTEEEVMGQQFIWFFYSQSEKKIGKKLAEIKDIFTQAENAGIMVLDDVNPNDINIDMLVCSDNGVSIARESLVTDKDKEGEENHFLYVVGQGNKLKEEDVLPILKLISGNVLVHAIKTAKTAFMRMSEEDVGKGLRELNDKISEISATHHI